MEGSAMHIFHSALLWSPTSSLIRGIYQNQSTAEAKLMNAVDTTWDACIRKMPVYDRVHRVVFSHKGTLIAFLGTCRMKIFDATTGGCLGTLDGQWNFVQAIALSHDDNFLVSGHHDGTVKVSDVQTGNFIQIFQGHTGTVRSVEFSPCGTMIASGAGDKTIRIWNLSSSSCECCLEGHSGWVWAVCWSTKWNQVISGSGDATVRIWDVSKRTCSRTIRAHARPVTSVASFQDLVASGDEGGIIKVHDLSSGHVLQAISTYEGIHSVRFSARGDKLLYTNPDSASIWDLAKDVRLSTTSCDGRHAAFSPDGKFVVSGDGNFVKMWKSKSGYSNFREVEHHSYPVTNVRFAPDGQVMASRSYHNVVIWDPTSGDCLFAVDFREIQSTESDSSIVFSLNSKLFAYQSGREWIIWDVRTRLPVKKMNCNTSLVALSSDGNRLASVSSIGIDLWSLATGKRLSHLELDDQRQISKISFGVDGFSILATIDDGSLRSWRVCSAPSPGRGSSNIKASASLPMVLAPIRGKRPHQGGTPALTPPSQYLCYKHGDEWIVDENGMRILWIPQDRRNSVSIDVHGRKVGVGTKSGRVYMVDFSTTLS
jgi:WD40 repeat protein